MKPCSAWCRPDDGLHVYLSSARNRGGPKATFDDVRDCIGNVVTSTGSECVPAGMAVEIVAVDRAEAPDDPEWDVTFLLGVQAVDHHHHVHVSLT